MVNDHAAAKLDGIDVAFDDERAVSDAGALLAGTLAGRLGIEALVEQAVCLGERPGAANPGAKVMSLVSAMALGADSIDDCDLLRAARTGQVLGHPVLAPSTLGTFLRSFTFGHVRQLDRVLGETLRRAWAAGAGPGDGRLIVDVDSFVGEVHGAAKQGACFGYTRQRGYHPLLATRADTGEVLHIRLRKGSANTARGMLRFCDERKPPPSRSPRRCGPGTSPSRCSPSSGWAPGGSRCPSSRSWRLWHRDSGYRSASCPHTRQRRSGSSRPRRDAVRRPRRPCPSASQE